MSNEKFKVKFGLAVGDTSATIDATTGNIVTNGSLTLNGATSGSVKIAAPAVAGTQSYTLPTAQPAANNYVLVSQTNGTLSWAAGSGLGIALGDLTDVTLTSPAKGNFLYYNGTDWVNSSTVVSNVAGNRPVFQYDNSTAGVSTALTLRKNFGSSTFTTDSGAALKFQVDSDSQPTTEYGLFGFSYDAAAPSFFAATSINNGASYDTAFTAGTFGIDIWGQYFSLNKIQSTGTPTLNASLDVSRGSSPTVALLWNESTDRWQTTTDGSTYLNIPNQNLDTTSNVTFGDVAVNGGDLTTTATTFNLVTNATTTNIGNAGGPAGSAVPGQVNFAGNTFAANNYIKGAVRDATTALNGDVFSFSSGAGGRARGLSIDNSIDTTKRPTALLRAYGGGLAGGNPVAPFMGETARGTAASPTGLLAGNALVNFFAGGYADTSVGGSNPGWVSDTTGNVPASMSFGTQEDWTSGTSNLGTRFRVNLAPTSSGVTTQVTMELTPQTSAFRSDAFTWAQGKTGTTQNMALDVNGNLTITGDLRVNGNDILASDGLTNITLTSNTLTTIAGDLKVAGNDIQASTGATAITMVPITGNNPNTDFSGNIVKGALRTGNGETNGNIYEYTGPSGQSTGLSIDNTDKVADRTSIVLRNYGGSLASGLPRNNIIMEGARGTAASPTNISTSDNLFEIQGSGYTNSGWLSDLVNAPPVIVRARATEAWTNGVNNVGARFQVLLQPAATTLTAGGGSLQVSLNLAPEASSMRTDSLDVTDKTSNRSFVTAVANDGSGKPTFSVSKTDATSATEFPIVNFNTQRSSGGTYTPTQNNDRIGEFKFNGNALSGGSPGGTTGPGASINASATENWSTTAQGTQFNFNSIKAGTTTSYAVIQGSPDLISLSATQINLNTYTGSSGITGNKIVYNRVYGQWQYNTTITPAAANTAYVFPLGTQDFANIASVGSTSRLIPGALGMYKTQFSVQVANSDNGTEHTAYIWWRLNGVDVPNSMGRVTVPKGGATIAGWDNMINITNTSDYVELAYAVDDATHISFPAFGTTAFGPATASLFTTLIPVGA